MVRGGPEVRFHQGSTRVPPGSHHGSTRVPRGSARAAGWSGAVPPWFHQGSTKGSTRFCKGCGVVRGTRVPPSYTRVPPGFHQGFTRFCKGCGAVPPGFHQGSTKVPPGFHQVLQGLWGGPGRSTRVPPKLGVPPDFFIRVPPAFHGVLQGLWSGTGSTRVASEFHQGSTKFCKGCGGPGQS